MARKRRDATPVPEAAFDWVRAVFAAANRQATSALTRVPTLHEPELDMQFIAALNQAPPVAGIDGWSVYIETHFLGGRRLFMNWEVADIGLLVIFRDRGRVLRIKVGLLQSKRLYPNEVRQLPDLRRRHEIGFSTLLKSPDAFRALAAGRTFSFSEASRYRALQNGSEQEAALTGYEQSSGIPIYYLFYNPVALPWSATIPATDVLPLPSLDVGCRVVRAKSLTERLQSKAKGYSPSYADVAKLRAPFRHAHKAGWSIQHFVADELMRCNEGRVVEKETDHVLERLFYNRSGPISAAIAVTVEAPRGVTFALPAGGPESSNRP